MRLILALVLSIFATLATAADYTATVGTPLHAQVRYGFDDAVSITPSVSGTYNIDVVASTVYGYGSGD